VAFTRTVETVVATGTIGAVLATAHTAYNLRVLRVPPADPPIVAERVSVLVPARDEAARIEPCIRALLASEGVRDLEVLVLDDASTDGTADVVRRAAQGDPRLRVIDGSDQPLPSGWLGKTWACARLVETATGTVLLFVDADVVVAPRGVAATVALMRMSGLDLVSPYPRQLADGALPRLVQPLLQWSWLTTLPLRAAESSPRESLAAANGQLLAVDAQRYRSSGGHAIVRGEVLDDIALLRAVKRDGGRGVGRRRHARRHLPDVRRRHRARRGLHEVSVVGFRQPRRGRGGGGRPDVALRRPRRRCSRRAQPNRASLGRCGLRRRRGRARSRSTAYGAAGAARRAGPPGVGGRVRAAHRRVVAAPQHRVAHLARPPPPLTSPLVLE
jgi:hypothetical protein